MVETLQQYKRTARLTQKELARQLGISQAYLSQLCSGEATPSLPTARKIAELTGQPMTQVLAEYGLLTKAEAASGGILWSATTEVLLALNQADRKMLLAVYAALATVVMADVRKSQPSS